MTCSSALYGPAKVEGANSMDNKRYVCGNYNPPENCSGSCIECYYALTGTTSDGIPFLSYQESLNDYEETQAIELPETP